MTHLSDFSYLERCAIWTYITVYLFYSIYAGDKFKCLKLKSIITGELKSIITILLILMMLMQFMWDIVSTYVKYEEGFIVYEGNIITKPFSMWSSKHQKNMMAMDYVECVTFSLQVGVFFLMQTFWNYLSNTVAKKSFMGSFEFRFYIVWALGSMAMFPILQWVFRNDVNKREGIPQLAYGVEALLTSLLGIRSHFRFKRIIALSQRNNGASNKAIVTRLSYFKDMNVLISIILFSYASSFIILCSDGLTEEKIINSNKFATDTIIANVNICTVFLWLLLISIFHPRPQYNRTMADTVNSHNESSFRYSTTPKAQTVGNNRCDIDESSRGITENSVSDSKFAMPSSANNNNNGGFMRAMSPVTVDYPYSLSNDTMPLTSPTGMGRPLSPPESQKMSYKQQSRSMAIEDPYSNQPVMFSMMNISTVKNNHQSQSRYTNNSSPTSPRQEHVPMYGISSNTNRAVSPHNNRYMDDNSMSEYEQTAMPHKVRRPSWERANKYNMDMPTSSPHPRQSDEQMVRDWLWQSPDRRNA